MTAKGNRRDPTLYRWWITVCINHPRATPSKVAREQRPPAAGSVSLASGDTLVDQDLNLNTPIFSASGLRLVRCRRPIFAHRARRNNMPHRHAALLHQVSDDCF